MRVFVVDNVHIVKDRNAVYYSPSIYNYSFLERYLKVFDEVRFIGKVKYVDEVDSTKYNILSGKHVEIVELPWYQGLFQMLQMLPSLISIYKKSCEGCDCYIYRVAQMESFFAYLFRDRKKPYAIEVVNDPATFVDIPMVMRIFSIVMLKWIAANAQGASYVTKEYLQGKYPTAKSRHLDKFETYYSSVELSETDIYTDPLEYDGKSVFRIVHVSNAINSDVKGHYTLLNAACKVIRDGKNIEIICIGDGSKIDEYKAFVNDKNISNRVHFIGRLHNRKELLDKLRSCNLLVLPTKMEGLPRTIIEAMAVGLPCISTPIAGIPEIIDRKYLFSPNDYNSFATEIERLIDHPQELFIMSKKNLLIAKSFTNLNLEKRRTWFYRQLYDRARKEN